MTTEQQKVILDGQFFYKGHKDAWRAGIIAGEVRDMGPTQQFVMVECQPRGRERKVRLIDFCAWHLLKDTPELRKKLLEHGIDPEKPYGRVRYFGTKLV